MWSMLSGFWRKRRSEREEKGLHLSMFAGACVEFSAVETLLRSFLLIVQGLGLEILYQGKWLHFVTTTT